MNNRETQSRIVSIVLATLLLATSNLFFTSTAHAVALLNARSFFDWVDLNITTDPGVSISGFGSTPETASASSRFELDSIEALSDSAFDNDWVSNTRAETNYPTGPGSESFRQISNNANGPVSSNSIGSGSGTSRLNSRGTMQHNYNFIVSGSGNITFSIDYNLGTSVQSSSLDQVIAGASAVFSLNNLSIPNGILLDPALPGEDVDVASVSTSLPFSGLTIRENNQLGVISVTGFFSDGERGLLIGQATSSITYIPDQSTRTIPEPTTLALMGIGLAGLGYRRRKIRIAS